MQPIRVKPLVWVLEDEDWWRAKSLGLTYVVRQAPRSVRIRMPDQDRFHEFDGPLHAAIAAAEADYAARVLSVVEAEEPRS